MTTTQDSTEDWLSEIFERSEIWEYDDITPSEFLNWLDEQVIPSLKKEIRQHMLSEAIELVGDDEKCNKSCGWLVGTCHHVDNNELRVELRKAFTEKYGERE